MLPAAIAPLVAGYAWQPVAVGESGARVFRLKRQGGPTLFLKCATGPEAPQLQAEAERLRWLAGRGVPVPGVVAFAPEPGESLLLLQALPGRSGEAIEPERIAAVVVGFAQAIRRLHAQPIDRCPFDQRLATQIARARERAGAGLVDEADFDAVRLGMSAGELLLRLERERPRKEDLVLTHGDACLPNLIFEGDRFGGFVDCGRTGIADRYQDLALAARSIAGNWGAHWLPLFFQACGVPDPDPAKLDYYCLLDEFF
jgi:aminoglycoside 3'-phosphotransferase-2